MRSSRYVFFGTLVVFWIAMSICALNVSANDAAVEDTAVVEDTAGCGEKCPNFLLIVVDDMGYSDPGCYGGEIETPNLDRLAADGIRFTAFCNTSRCWPSRSSLMTGYYPQQLRMDPVHPSHPGWITYLPQHLRELGYRNYHSGKWHVGCCPNVLDAGFDDSYEILDTDRHFSTQSHRMNNRAMPSVERRRGEEGDYYSTNFIARQTIEQLTAHAEQTPDQPFFAYTAFISPHFPIMAPAATVAKYHETYIPGWDAIRSVRFDRMRTLGIYEGEISAREPKVGPPYPDLAVLDELGPGEILFPIAWDELTSEQQAFQAAKMSVHAAMVDEVDRAIGRILEQIRSMGQLENTVVMFLSDNGASAEICIRGDRHDPAASLGSPESFLCLGPGFSTASNTPFRRHKTWVHEGGISTPLIVCAPHVMGENLRGTITRQPGHLVDLTPTILELAGVKELIGGDEVKTYPGVSLAPLLRDEVSRIDGRHLWFSHEGNQALKRYDADGEWKIVLTKKEQTSGGPERWELYDLRTDRAEQHDRSGEYPERTVSMIAEWKQMNEQFLRDSQE